MASILLIDDDELYLDIASQVLGDQGFEVSTAPHPEAAFSLLFERTFDLILCDLHLPFTEGSAQEEYLFSTEVGLRTAKELHDALSPETKVLVMSMACYSDLARIAGYLFPVPVHSKPQDIQQLSQLVRAALSNETEVFMLQ